MKTKDLKTNIIYVKINNETMTMVDELKQLRQYKNNLTRLLEDLIEKAHDTLISNNKNLNTNN